MTVREATHDELLWLRERVGMAADDPQMRGLVAEAHCSDGCCTITKGMVAFTGWTKSACELHVALDTPVAARPLLREVFRLAFDQLGRSVVFARVCSDNERALKLDRHLGFREVARLKDAWDVGVDIIVMEMRREDCRYRG